jgi:23S rRNA pseudouridine2605 synthase
MPGVTPQKKRPGQKPGMQQPFPPFQTTAGHPNRPPRPRRSTEQTLAGPQRLHKLLADLGLGSRRHLEEMIIAGRITVNRQPAELGQKVGPGDEVRVNGKPVPLRFATPQTRVLAYHKPTGEIVSRDDPEGRPNVFTKLPPVKGGRWVAVGRLDLNSEGLLLFTTSGELANKLMHPRFEMEREYAVRVFGRLDPELERRLLEGVELEDGLAKVNSIVDGGGEGANHWYHVVLTEGRNREVRRLFEALGLQVSRLIRTRFGPVAMHPQLKLGMRAELAGEDLAKLLEAAGLPASEANRPERGPRPGQGPGKGPLRGGPNKGPRGQGKGQGKGPWRGPGRGPDRGAPQRYEGLPADAYEDLDEDRQPNFDGPREAGQEGVQRDPGSQREAGAQRDAGPRREGGPQRARGPQGGQGPRPGQGSGPRQPGTGEGRRNRRGRRGKRRSVEEKVGDEGSARPAGIPREVDDTD